VWKERNQNGDSAEKDGVRTEVLNDDSSLRLLFGDHHHDAEDLTLYSSNTRTGRDESEATYIPHETSCVQ
jgi:hypothetical protein